jgi:hypothetical protein
MKDAAPTPSKKGRQAAIAALRKRLDTQIGDDALWQIIGDYDRARPVTKPESRATALVLGAILEQGLQTVILSHCVPLEIPEQKRLFQGGEDGPMNFAVKIRMGYALSIYGPDSRDDLDVVRHVRNLFAHAPDHILFLDDDVIALCDQIKWISKFHWGGIAGPSPVGPMKQYIETVRHYFSYFILGARRGPVRYQEYEVPELYSQLAP